MAPTSRHQPRRAVRDKIPDKLNESGPAAGMGLEARGPGTLAPQKGGIVKASRRVRKRAPKRPPKKQLAALEKKVNALDPEHGWGEQSQLLGVATTTDPSSLPVPPFSAAKPAGSGVKRNWKRRNSHRYMDDIFGFSSDDNDNDEEEEDKEVERRRRDCWVPEMELRGPRPAARPRRVPDQLWMAYCFLDDYVYRESLSPARVAELPLMDDVWAHQQGGPPPPAPAGFRWDDRRRLVPAGKAL
ncbi:hypothetical protein GGR56DRAFT_322125 [Xylariaceae sp. FL0804]|nr:hypothetical protein GGR56DRAFT_322125 [Xylariaceae sp. FL0804]